MSQLPENWSFVPLGEVATLQRGFDLPVQNREPGNFPIFAANGPVGTHSKAKVCGPGVVTGRSGTLGEVHYVDSDFWPLNTALWVKEFHGNDPRWVFRLLAWMNLEQFTRGAGVPTLNRNLVHVVEVPLPPLAEQKRIAAILDAADTLRAKRRESLAQLDTLLQSTFLDMFGDPVTNPKGWVTCALESVSKKITDGTHKTPIYTETGVEFLSAKDIKDGAVQWGTGKFISHEEHEQLKRRCNPELGDLLLAKSGSLGSIAIIDRGHEFSLFESLCLIKLNNNKISAPFLASMIRSPRMQSHLLGKNKGVAIKHLHLVDVRQLEIITPPLDLQHRFASIVQSVEQQKARLREHLAELDKLFASLQQRAFNGDL